ncbi:putative alanine--tRNA ligase [Aspergillus brunneoviolaceus CBS 621.78]|uniref:Threonyl/alanyl tRNA synthetase n=1 Tax=Aspergillus brunneoviolaceus CBS 621.78 TaxID=1450534 RepID=A0ACD1GJY6_9EURO|nr:threonyl/alanyl tRNA synthetase [Aspergillus brunneoviolaceus CBS 621.78]RAH49550.1 threonyl/alanyl tRNA synthetase [Aspergillus brunneoviolaceus CBS 621.78]
MGSNAPRTFLAYQHDAKLHTLDTTVTAVLPFSALEESNRFLFKQGNDEDHIVITEQTIFHPQGGGQPSDVGTLSHTATATKFTVTAVRMGQAPRDGQVLHLGRFEAAAAGTDAIFKAGDSIQQAIDTEKRLLYSRLHTAGHVLGSAVRHLLENEVADFDELKASHFPDLANCEFRGLIDGKWKEPIQSKVDEFLAAKLPVQVEWWDEEDFRVQGLERLIPDREALGVPAGEKFRVVHIVGAEVYPCGGTHVETTDLCGPTKVRKISRSKGISKISYAVE